MSSHLAGSSTAVCCTLHRASSPQRTLPDFACPLLFCCAQVAVKLLDLENMNCSLDEIVREAQVRWRRRTSEGTAHWAQQRVTTRLAGR